MLTSKPMSTQSEIEALLRQTPAYLTHITIGRWLIEWLLRELHDKDKQIETLRQDLDSERKRNCN